MKEVVARLKFAGDRGPLLYMEPTINEIEGESEEDYNARLDKIPSAGIEGMYVSGDAPFADHGDIEVTIAWDDEAEATEAEYPPIIEEEKADEDEKWDIRENIRNVLEKFTAEELVTIMMEDIIMNHGIGKLEAELRWYEDRLKEDKTNRQ